MYDTKMLTLKVKVKGIVFVLENAQIGYWCEQSWVRPTYYEFKSLIIPSWAEHLRKDLESYLKYNVDKVANMGYTPVMEIEL